MNKNNVLYVPDEYVLSLCNEIKIRKAFNNIDSLNTVYIGGGTPSLLRKEQLKKIMDAVFFALKKNPDEVTIEVNPDDVSEEELDIYSSLGITRISCGIQSLNHDALKNVNRRADEKQNISAMNILKNHWKGIFSVDLISGLPFENEELSLETLSKVIAFRPKHISLYSLTIEEETPLGKKLLGNPCMYDFDLADKIWIIGRDFLLKNGYFQYEVSNFCLSGYECKHNMVYWNLNDYLGCGSGGTLSVYGRNAVRFTNVCDVNKYIDYWKNIDFLDKDCLKNAPGTKENLSIETQKFEFFMMGLRTLKGVSEEDFKKRFSTGFPKKVMSTFKKWEEKGLCSIKNINGEHFYSLNMEGILFLNDFLTEIL